MRICQFFLFLALLPLNAAAQSSILGSVHVAGTNEPLPGASVGWAGTSTGTITGGDGRFSLPLPSGWPATLVATYVGHKPDSLMLMAPPTVPINLQLEPAIELRAVEVVERTEGTRLSTRTINATESIGQKELKRAACCDLSESFETNATVDVSYSDAISGTKTIRMLGLDGKYAQMSLENVPFVRGLSTSSGLTLIPGTWIQDINLSKGTGTAVNGPNAMTGQIDLCLLNPLDEPPLFVNLYGNSQGRMEANVHAAQRTGSNSANLLLVHGNWFDQAMDQNDDGLLDQPRTRRINVMNRWMHLGERKSGQVTLRAVHDERIGGQDAMHSAHADHSAHGLGLYRINVLNRMMDGIAKHGWVFEGDPTKSIGLIAAGRWHETSSEYGLRRYDGEQRSAYLSAIYQQLLGDGNDQVKGGLSFQYDDYTERFMSRSLDDVGDTLQDLDLGRTERMPGIFAEHTLKRGLFTLVSGIRYDANDWFGEAWSPRLHAKYDLGPLTVLRASVGHGFRTANPLVENAAVMASSRYVSIEGRLGMERAWNMGASVLHKFKWLGRKWAIGADGYHTRFTDQVVTDLDRDPLTLALYMLDGPSYANSLLTDVQVELSRAFQLKLSHRYYEVRSTYDGRLLERPFTPSHRGLIDLAFTSPDEHWRFDINLNLFGEGRLPDTRPNPSDELRFPVRSPGFATLHAQITFSSGAWEFYLGGENLTSTLQQQQVIAPDDPYGPYFDASLIWGPTNKAMAYGGLRFTLKNNKTK
ncbi:MAG: TonB-dependent receptor [Flavobacteriales bacterium]|nr:TonB-dependent receptor [Flavobacteriales bacterium]